VHDADEQIEDFCQIFGLVELTFVEFDQLVLGRDSKVKESV